MRDSFDETLFERARLIVGVLPYEQFRIDIVEDDVTEPLTVDLLVIRFEEAVLSGDPARAETELDHLDLWRQRHRVPDASGSTPPYEVMSISETTRRRALRALNVLRDTTTRSSSAEVADSGFGWPPTTRGLALGSELFEPDADPDAASLHRTPHLTLTGAPTPLPPGAEVLVEAFLDTAALEEGDEEVVLLDPSAAGVPMALDVWLTASSHFRVEQPLAQVVVDAGEEVSSTASFRVVVVEDPPSGERARMTATFAWKGRPCGSITREPAVVGTDGEGGASRGPIVIDRSSAPIDLTVTVARTGGEGSFQVKVQGPGLPAGGLEGVWTLDRGAAAWVNGVLTDFFDATSARHRSDSLRAAGVKLFDAAPQCFRDAYWRLHEEGRAPRSMLVCTDDPIVPWELMVPNRPGMKRTEHRPLALDCAISRGMLGEYPSMPLSVPLGDSIVISPPYRANLALKHASAEAQLLIDGFGGEATHPTTYDELSTYFDTRSASLLHFICHGRNEASGIQSIDLGNGVLHSTVIVSSALGDSCQETHPLVFLNACEVGRLASGLASVDGFAPAFLKMGASCVVAPMWPVDDAVAFAFASGFYRQVQADPTRSFASIISELRHEAYGDDAVDTWAAYVIYADPLASSVGPTSISARA